MSNQAIEGIKRIENEINEYYIEIGKLEYEKQKYIEKIEIAKHKIDELRWKIWEKT